MSTSASMKDNGVQTDSPQTTTVSTNTAVLLWADSEQNGYGSEILETVSTTPMNPNVQDDRRSLRYRSELTLTDLSLSLSNTLLIERLRLLQEEAELEGQVQEVRLATLRAKKELLLNRLRNNR